MKYFYFIIGILIWLGLTLTVHADFDLPAWEWRSKIIGGSSSGSDFVLLDLPSEFFSYLKSDLSDLRVANQDGEVPYVVAQERESESFTSVPARMFNLSYTPGNATSFEIDLGQSGVFHNSVNIETASENFRRIVEIQGSNDQAAWRTLNPRGQIFDYTVRDIKPVSVRDTNVTYPDATFRYLLVKVFDQGEESLKVRGVKVSRKVSMPSRELSYSPTLEIMENKKEQITDVILDIGAHGIPHRRGRLTTSSVNFNRAVAIFDSDNKTDWRPLSNAYLFAIDTAKFMGSNLDFSYPESNRRYLRLSIYNRDDKPISVSGAVLYGIVRRILFRFDSMKDYYVYLSNAEARRPQYDIEKISQYVDASLLNRANAGPVEKNSDYVAAVIPKPPLTERSPYILPTLLGLVVAILAFLLLRILGGKIQSEHQ